MKGIALITGICGQDGSYLAEYLLDNYMEEMQDEVLRLGK